MRCFHAGLASLSPAYTCSAKVRAHHKRLFVHALRAFNKILGPYGHRGVFGEAARAVRAIAMPSLPVSLARI